MSSKVLIQVKNKGFDDIIYSMEREWYTLESDITSLGKWG
jgi:hypothetical protein